MVQHKDMFKLVDLVLRSGAISLAGVDGLFDMFNDEK